MFGTRAQTSTECKSLSEVECSSASLHGIFLTTGAALFEAAMNEQTVFVRSMVARFPNLSELFEEHIKDNFGEVLPHVFFGDVTRYLLSLLLAENGRSLRSRRELRDVLGYLEEAYSGGNEKMRELISASFLENLPRSGDTGAQIREMIGPNLRKQLDVIG
jgi:hypothetical protein